MINRKQLIAVARRQGLKGKATLESITDFYVESGTSGFAIDDDGKEVTLLVKDFADAWGKDVMIRIEGATLADLTAEDDAEADPEAETEGKAEGDEEDEVDPEEKAASTVARKKAFREQQDSLASVKKVGHSGGSFSRIDSAKKMYDRAVKDGGRFKGRAPLFLNADRSEYFGAKARFATMGALDYSQKSADEKIITKGSSVVNSTGGALVFYEELPELIENIEENGAARRAIGVTNMRDGQQTVSKITADVTMYDVGEGDAITASDPTFGNVSLVASKTAALVKENSELLNDSAFSIGDILGRSISRAVGKWEDESVFLGSHNRQGITDILIAGGTNVNDTAVANWGAITVANVQDTLALLPAWAYDDPNFGYVCSLSFAQSVFYRFGLDAGGNTGDNMANGFAGLRYNGFPIFISQVMPKAYSANQLSCYMGAWSHSAKFGVVTGSEQMATSDQRYFENDQVAFRYTQRWAHNLHTVNTTAFESGIVALQD